jgi:hypothetical protein
MDLNGRTNYFLRQRVRKRCRRRFHNNIENLYLTELTDKNSLCPLWLILPNRLKICILMVSFLALSP